jgi:hypothetical protein
MIRRIFGVVLLTIFAALSLSGCSCFIQAQKGEAPPPRPPEAQRIVPPEPKKEVPVQPTGSSSPCAPTALSDTRDGA